MSAVLIDYGCHSFSYRLASRLRSQGFPIRYLANGSLESPNLTSLEAWQQNEPGLVHSIRCAKPYGKVNLTGRLKGEIEWAGRCIRELDREQPSVVIGSCIPIAVLTRIQSWTARHRVPFVYWLQDIQGRAIHDLLGRKLGYLGRVLGSFAYIWEQHMMERSRTIITIASGHDRELPSSIRRAGRFSLLENWADIQDLPVCRPDNDWAARHHLDKTLNVVYSGTLGMKHDLATFIALASAFRHRKDVRVVVISGGEAAGKLRAQAAEKCLDNLVVLPFQHYREVPSALGSAAVFIAPLERSAGGFCVPSKILAYLCAGRPTVIAIDRSNPAAHTIERAEAGCVVKPGDPQAFIAAVQRFLDDPALRRRTGESARRYAERTFDLNIVSSKFLNILNNSGIALTPRPPALQEMPLVASA